MSKRPPSTRPKSEELMSLDEAVKVPPKHLMTPEKPIRGYDWYMKQKKQKMTGDSPTVYSAVQGVEIPNTAEARKIAEDATKSEEKKATGKTGGRKTRRRSHKRRSTRRRHGKKRR